MLSRVEEQMNEEQLKLTELQKQVKKQSGQLVEVERILFRPDELGESALFSSIFDSIKGNNEIRIA